MDDDSHFQTGIAGVSFAGKEGKEKREKKEKRKEKREKRKEKREKRKEKREKRKERREKKEESNLIQYFLFHDISNFLDFARKGPSQFGIQLCAKESPPPRNKNQRGIKEESKKGKKEGKKKERKKERKEWHLIKCSKSQSKKEIRIHPLPNR